MALSKSARRLLVPLVLSLVASCASGLAAVVVRQDISSSGTITTSPNIGVFSDAGCTNIVSSINWGSIAAGAISTQTLYVKNTGTGTITLNMTAAAWSPAAAGNYITLAWNREGANLSAAQTTQATLTLTVSPNITGIISFGNTITISGTG
jgi:hypothetical protein